MRPDPDDVAVAAPSMCKRASHPPGSSCRKLMNSRSSDSNLEIDGLLGRGRHLPSTPALQQLNFLINIALVTAACRSRLLNFPSLYNHMHPGRRRCFYLAC
jgi:hypothetical protein